MKINILNTNELYNEILSMGDSDRAAFFDQNMLLPFAPMFEKLMMPRNPDMIGCLPLTGNDDTIKEMLSKLSAFNTFDTARRTIEFAEKHFKSFDIKMPSQLLLGIFLANPAVFTETNGYSGIGSIPGYIQIMIAPNDYNLPRMASCIAHEFHHNVLFNNVKWNFMNVSLSQYLAVEGLAECFASELYGEEFVGPWAKNISDENLWKASSIITKALDTTGFMEVRKYMYGDHPMVPGGKELGIPYCAGYAVGYRAVQHYLSNTSVSVAEATKEFIDGEDIVKKSGFFAL